MSFTLQGIPVSSGIAIGRAYLLAPIAFEVPRYYVQQEQISQEQERFRLAQATVEKELQALRLGLPVNAPEEVAAFLDVHMLILKDPMLIEASLELIQVQGYNAEWALATQLEALSAHFELMEDDYLRERRVDIEQVGDRIFKALAGLEGFEVIDRTQSLGADEHMILVARDISPTDMLQFKTRTLKGCITDLGGGNSHTAIVARSLNIPVAVGVQHASQLICQDDLIIMDGDLGVVIVDPSQDMLDQYRSRLDAEKIHQESLHQLLASPAQTADGHKIQLFANIDCQKRRRRH